MSMREHIYERIKKYSWKNVIEILRDFPSALSDLISLI